MPQGGSDRAAKISHLERQSAGFSAVARALLVKLCAAWIVSSCAAPLSPGSRDVRIGRDRAEAGPQGRVVTQIEMQQAIERFTGTFLDGLIESSEKLAHASGPEERRIVLKRVLLYSSSVLDIATGPYPEVNVLDLVVFLRLSRSTLEAYWIPQVFGENGRPLADAFLESENHAWQLASKVLAGAQREQLSGMIDAWQLANRGRLRVEMIRFEEFSAHGATVAAELKSDAAGLLATVKGAAQTADRALLLAERGMFLAHRLPFLMRLQARVGADEVLGDSLSRLSDMDALAAHTADARLIMDQMAHLLVDGKAAAREARLTLDALEPLMATLPPLGELHDVLAAGNNLADKSSSLLREIRALTPGDPEQLVSHLEVRAEALVRRSVLWIGAVGGVWIVLFWCGYYLVRRSGVTGSVPPRAARGSGAPGPP